MENKNKAGLALEVIGLPLGIRLTKAVLAVPIKPRRQVFGKTYPEVEGVSGVACKEKAASQLMTRYGVETPGQVLAALQ
jgi:hypothetical protein